MIAILAIPYLRLDCKIWVKDVNRMHALEDVLLVMIMDVEMNDCLDEHTMHGSAKCFTYRMMFVDSACCTKCDLLTHVHWCAVFFSTNWVSGQIIRISKVCSKECQKQTCVAPELELSPACVTTLSLHYAVCCVSCM